MRVSSTPRFIGIIADVSGILDHPPAGDDDGKCGAPECIGQDFAIPRRDAPESLTSFPSDTEGAGNAGCALHPRSRVQVCTKKCAHEHTGSAEAIRHSLRNGFTAYAALSPATNSSCHRHRRINGFARPGRTCENLRRLDTSNGCQDHTVLPYATRPRQVLRRIVHPRRSFCEAGEQRRSSCAPADRSRSPKDLALRSRSRPTLPRPPHPIPTFVTMANAPREG
jgi:hypothetical protein